MATRLHIPASPMAKSTPAPPGGRSRTDRRHRQRSAPKVVGAEATMKPPPLLLADKPTSVGQTVRRQPIIRHYARTHKRSPLPILSSAAVGDEPGWRAIANVIWQESSERRPDDRREPITPSSSMACLTDSSLPGCRAVRKISSRPRTVNCGVDPHLDPHSEERGLSRDCAIPRDRNVDRSV